MKRRRTRFLFWHKIVLLVTGCVVACTLCIGLATLRALDRAGRAIGQDSKEILSEQAEMFVEKLVEERAAELDVQLAQAQAAASYGAIFLRETLGPPPPHRSIPRELLETLRKRTSHCTAVYYVPSTGKMTVHASNARTEKGDSSTESISRPRLHAKFDPEDRTGDVVWSAIHVNPFSSHYDLVIDALSPVVSASTMEGFIGVSVSLTRMVAQFNQFQPIRGGYSFLVDTDFRLIGAPPHARVELLPEEKHDRRGIVKLIDTGNPTLDTALQRMVAGESALRDVSLRSGGRYLAYHPLRNVNWRLGIVVPVQMATAASGELVSVIEDGISEVLAGITYWACAFLVVSLLAGIMLAHHLTSPVRELSAMTEDIAEGHLEKRVRIASRDEMGVLASAFNTMVDRIQGTVANLNRKNEELLIANAVMETQQEASPDGILVVDEEGRMLSYNSRFVSMWDLPPDVVASSSDELAVRTVRNKLVDPEGFEARIAYLYKHPNQKSLDELHLVDGSTFERYTAPMYGSEDRNYGRVWFFRDVTERRRAEEELQRLRSLLSSIIDSMPSVVVGVDPQARVTQWNREAERVTGVSAIDARGCTLVEVFPRLANQMEKVWIAIREGRRTKDPKVVTNTPNGVRYEDVTIYPLVRDGVEGAVIRIDDVTERRRIEEMMIQSEKMLSVGGLAAGMAHEINNPLAGIIQNVQVMRNRISGDLSRNEAAAEECGTSMQAIREYMTRREIFAMIESVLDSGRRASRIIQNMLSFSRKGEPEMVPHDLVALLEEAVELAQNDYDLKKKHDFRRIRIVREFDDNPPMVSCEASKIQQVFLNLLKNGAAAMQQKYGEPAQSMVDNGPTFLLRVSRDNQMARVEIEDNGPGMDESIRKRVFEPFFTTKAVGVGTGLGLSVSYFIITENHGGVMEVESTPGEGAKFIIRLPLEART